jgi:hypothetical protein
MNAFTARRSSCSSFCTPLTNKDPIGTTWFLHLRTATDRLLLPQDAGRILSLTRRERD